jgi:hypothetical protein
LVTVYDDSFVGFSQHEARVYVTLNINLTPEFPDLDPSKGETYSYTVTGAINIDVFRLTGGGYLEPRITVPITGSYLLDTFPTTFNKQTGTLVVRDKTGVESGEHGYISGGRWNVKEGQIISTKKGLGSGLAYYADGSAKYNNYEILSEFVLERR